MRASFTTLEISEPEYPGDASPRAANPASSRSDLVFPEWILNIVALAGASGRGI